MEYVAWIIAIVICLPFMLFFGMAFLAGVMTIVGVVLGIPLTIMQALRK